MIIVSLRADIFLLCQYYGDYFLYWKYGEQSFSAIKMYYLKLVKGLFLENIINVRIWVFLRWL
jgi:hypothetical protein